MDASFLPLIFLILFITGYSGLFIYLISWKKNELNPKSSLITISKISKTVAIISFVLPLLFLVPYFSWSGVFELTYWGTVETFTNRLLIIGNILLIILFYFKKGDWGIWGKIFWIIALLIPLIFFSVNVLGLFY